ncbi:rhodanese [Halorientalis sp. IM1011]|uniref:rhodanese-like domain-containing protein n=1 Tax=Halorientalis sp. IM1011 TaxID=1932360 RepID=UPI00097CC78D|nr:rhodanese-like domain-containing protein [Halorientalis sp. IM1011]AQL43165.1 rhodanese [Halorientalis sp. IM1011]
MIDEITPEELAALLDADEPVRIVDIRSPAAFRRGHVPGSENVPFPQLPTRVDEFAGADRIVTVCPHGHDSLRAGRLIVSSEAVDDATVQSLAGGLEAWDGEVEAGADGRADDEGPAAPF